MCMQSNKVGLVMVTYGHIPEAMVKNVTLLEVVGVGDEGGLNKRKPSFVSLTCRSLGLSWYL